MKYRIQLDTKTQQFIVIDPSNQARTGRGATIEQAVAQLNR